MVYKNNCILGYQGIIGLQRPITASDGSVTYVAIHPQNLQSNHHIYPNPFSGGQYDQAILDMHNINSGWIKTTVSLGGVTHDMKILSRSFEIEGNSYSIHFAYSDDISSSDAQKLIDNTRDPSNQYAFLGKKDGGTDGLYGNMENLYYTIDGKRIEYQRY